MVLKQLVKLSLSIAPRFLLKRLTPANFLPYSQSQLQYIVFRYEMRVAQIQLAGLRAQVGSI